LKIEGFQNSLPVEKRHLTEGTRFFAIGRRTQFLKSQQTGPKGDKKQTTNGMGGNIYIKKGHGRVERPKKKPRNKTL